MNQKGNQQEIFVNVQVSCNDVCLKFNYFSTKIIVYPNELNEKSIVRKTLAHSKFRFKPFYCFYFPSNSYTNKSTHSIISTPLRLEGTHAANVRGLKYNCKCARVIV